QPQLGQTPGGVRYDSHTSISRRCFMTSPHTPLHVVFYYEQDRWIAHCLQFDLIGDGETKSEAIDVLMQAISMQVEASLESHDIENLFHPADGRYFGMFAMGRDIEIDGAAPNVPGLQIEEIIARECVSVENAAV